MNFEVNKSEQGESTPEIVEDPRIEEILEDLRKPENRQSDEAFFSAHIEAVTRLEELFPEESEMSEVAQIKYLAEIFHYEVDRLIIEDVGKNYLHQAIEVSMPIELISLSFEHEAAHQERADEIKDQIHDKKAALVVELLDNTEEELYQHLGENFLERIDSDTQERVEGLLRHFQDSLPYKLDKDKKEEALQREQERIEKSGEARRYVIASKIQEFLLENNILPGSTYFLGPKRIREILEVVSEIKDSQLAKGYAHVIRNRLVGSSIVQMFDKSSVSPLDSVEVEKFVLELVGK